MNPSFLKLHFRLDSSLAQVSFAGSLSFPQAPNGNLLRLPAVITLGHRTGTTGKVVTVLHFSLFQGFLTFL